MGASRAPLVLNLIGSSLVIRDGPIEGDQDKPTQDAIVVKALWRVRRSTGVKVGPCSEDGEIIRFVVNDPDDYTRNLSCREVRVWSLVVDLVERER